jgi:hypothetical protein
MIKVAGDPENTINADIANNIFKVHKARDFFFFSTVVL